MLHGTAGRRTIVTVTLEERQFLQHHWTEQQIKKTRANKLNKLFPIEMWARFRFITDQLVYLHNICNVESVPFDWLVISSIALRMWWRCWHACYALQMWDFSRYEREKNRKNNRIQQENQQTHWTNTRLVRSVWVYLWRSFCFHLL